MRRITFSLVIVLMLAMMALHAANLPPIGAGNGELLLECVYSSTTTKLGQAINCTSGAGGGTPPYSWLWTVDGKEVASFNNTDITSMTLTFNTTGIHTVCVNVTDSSEPKQEKQCCKNVTVLGPWLTIAKIDAPDPVNAGGTLNYTITVTNNGTASATNVTVVDDYDETVLNITDPDGGDDNGYNITWNGELTIPMGGSLSYNIRATVSPTATGNSTFYNTANVTCAEGVSNSTSINTTVAVSPLSLNCSVSPNPTKGGHPTNFNATASGGVGNRSYFWDFGDGGNSTEEDPTYTYATDYINAWNYTVCVNVTDSSEPKQEKQCCVNVTVNRSLMVECWVSPNTTTVDQAVNCTAGASGGVGDYTWLWTADDGWSDSAQNTTHAFNTS